MRFVLTKKDIVALNQEFEDGSFHNEPSLDFALSHANKSENWINGLSLLTRAILIDHVFQEGNKRTAALLIKTYAEYEGHKIYNDKLVNLIKEILLKDITDINKIEGMLKDVIK